MAKVNKAAIIREECADGKSVGEILAAHPDFTPSYIKRVIRDWQKAQGQAPPAQAAGQAALPTEGPLAGLGAFLAAVGSNPALSERVHIDISVRISEDAVPSAKPNPEGDLVRVLNPVDLCRRFGTDVARGILARCGLDTLHALVREHVPDPRGYATKWTDPQKVIDYIVERASAIAGHGEVFVT